jgi:hypothetical protein
VGIRSTESDAGDDDAAKAVDDVLAFIAAREPGSEISQAA